MSRVLLAFHRALHLDHVVDRNAFGDGDDEIESGIHAFENGVGGEGRRDEDRAEAVAPVCFTASATVSKMGTSCRRARRIARLCRA